MFSIFAAESFLTHFQSQIDKRNLLIILFRILSLSLSESFNELGDRQTVRRDEGFLSLKGIEYFWLLIPKLRRQQIEETKSVSRKGSDECSL